MLIFVLTRIAERAILNQEKGFRFDSNQKRNPAFLPLEDWEEPNPLYPGSGKALSMPWRHFYASFCRSFRPPWPIIRWIPGLRHSFLPAPHFVSKHGGRSKSDEELANYGAVQSSIISDVEDEEVALLREGQFEHDSNV